MKKQELKLERMKKTEEAALELDRLKRAEKSSSGGTTKASSSSGQTRATVRSSRPQGQKKSDDCHSHGATGNCCGASGDTDEILLEAKIAAKTKGRVVLTAEEDFPPCCDGENFECSGHAPSICYGETTDECRAHHDSAPCRHGHNISTLIRTPEDCRSCLRHMGGAYVSPRYPVIRQRMLKTLNSRRDHSEELVVEHAMDKVSPVSKPAVKSIPCGKKERLILVNPDTQTEDVDDIVRMIEGTKVTNDPRKAAKKARQKEKKVQQKIEDERQREEEERKRIEEEERIKREQEMREEEEKRKAEEQKRLARKIKKKNRKKKDAEKDKEESAPSASNNNGLGEKLVREYGAVQPVVDNSPAETVRKAFENITPTPQGTDGKTRMVTIRRHPCTSENQNVVTITLSDDNEGKHPVYMLVNGHLFLGDSNTLNNSSSASGGEPKQRPEPQTSDLGNDRKKNKKKKKKGAVSSNEVTAETIGSVPTMRQHSYSEYHSSPNNRMQQEDSVDLSSLNLPPGITITKVPNVDTAKRDFKNDMTSLTNNSNMSNSDEYPHNRYMSMAQNASLIEDRNLAQRLAIDDDLFVRHEVEEFEEVVSNKTRKKRNKAAKCNNEAMDDTPSTTSPVHGKPFNTARRRSQTSADVPCENGTIKWNGVKVAKPKSIKVNTNSSNPGPEKSQTPMQNRRDYQQRHREHANSPNHYPNNYNVMPRLARVNPKNDSVFLQNPNYPGMWQHRGLSAEVIEPPLRQRSPISPDSSSHSRQNPSGTVQFPVQGANQFTKPTAINGSQLVSGPSMWSRETPSKLGPVTTQPGQVEKGNVEGSTSWNPWVEWLGGSEHSTPENPSPSGLMPRDYIFKETQTQPSSNANVQVFPIVTPEIQRKSTVKSPIQRPVSGSSEYYPQQLSNGYGSDYESSKRLPYPGSTNFNKIINVEDGHSDAQHQLTSNTSNNRHYQNQMHSPHDPFQNPFTIPYEKNAYYYQENGIHGQGMVPSSNNHAINQDTGNNWTNFGVGQPELHDTLLQRRPSDSNTPLNSSHTWRNSFSNNGSPYNELDRYHSQSNPSNVINYIPSATATKVFERPWNSTPQTLNETLPICLENEVDSNDPKCLCHPIAQLNLNRNNWLQEQGHSMSIASSTRIQEASSDPLMHWENNPAFTSNY